MTDLLVAAFWIALGSFLTWALSDALKAVLKKYLIQIVKKHRVRPFWEVLGPSLLLWVLGWWVMQSPILGLVWLIILPVYTATFHRWKEIHRQRQLVASALPFFHALHGLIRAGLSLPAALFHLSQTLPTPFGIALQKFLRRYERGASLVSCLKRFRQSQVGGASTTLALLAMAYRNGLSLAPLLEKMLPLMEAEEISQKKLQAVMKSSVTQALLAFLLPWAIMVTLGIFQPKLLVEFSQTSSFMIVIVVALLWEGLGIYFLWRVSKFY